MHTFVVLACARARATRVYMHVCTGARARVHVCACACVCLYVHACAFGDACVRVHACERVAVVVNVRCSQQLGRVWDARMQAEVIELLAAGCKLGSTVGVPADVGRGTALLSVEPVTLGLAADCRCCSTGSVVGEAMYLKKTGRIGPQPR